MGGALAPAWRDSGVWVFSVPPPAWPDSLAFTPSPPGPAANRRFRTVRRRPRRNTHPATHIRGSYRGRSRDHCHLRGCPLRPENAVQDEPRDARRAVSASARAQPRMVGRRRPVREGRHRRPEGPRRGRLRHRRGAPPRPQAARQGPDDGRGDDIPSYAHPGRLVAAGQAGAICHGWEADRRRLSRARADGRRDRPARVSRRSGPDRGRSGAGTCGGSGAAFPCRGGRPR